MKKYKYDYGNFFKCFLSYLSCFLANMGKAFFIYQGMVFIKGGIDKYLLHYKEYDALTAFTIILVLSIMLGYLYFTFRSRGVYVNAQRVTIKVDILFTVSVHYNVNIPLCNIKSCNYYCEDKSKRFYYHGIDYPIRFFNWNSLVRIECTDGSKYYVPVKNADEFIKEINDNISISNISGKSFSLPLKNKCSAAVTELGIDYKVPALTNVFASSEGIVQLVQKWDKSSTGMQYLGNMLIVDNGNSVKTIYGNLHEIFVEDGMHISQGERIATTGNTGVCNEPQLHFEVRVNGKPIDPNQCLKELI